MEDILKRLRLGDVIVGDGSIGTILIERGLQHGSPPEAFNLTKPHVLEEIASLYREAGAEIITTNTFGASALRLQQFSLEGEMEAINRAAVEAVRRAVDHHAYVSASLGPTARMIKPLGKTDPEEVFACFKNQIAVLLAAGVDMICVETMTDLKEALLAVQAVRSLDSKIPIMATMTFGKTPRGYFTVMGTSVENASAALENAGADMIGSNCGVGMETMIGIAREFSRHTRLPIAIQANAGLPVEKDAGFAYPETPEFFAAKTVELLDIGVRIIGGCCGSGPEHIRAIRKVVDASR